LFRPERLCRSGRGVSEECIGVIQGTFDPDSYVHRYDILVPNGAALPAAQSLPPAQQG